MPDQFIVGVDIGSSKLCAVVAVRERGGAIRYVGHGSAASAGLRGGEVVDPAALSAAFTRAVEEARYLIGTPVHDLVVSVSGARIEKIDRAGGVDLAPGKPIDHADVVRAIASTRGSDPAGLHTVHRVVRTLAVDGVPTDDPTGRTGQRLEVATRDYAVPAHLVERLRRAADSAGVRIHTLIPEGVASAAAALSDAERESGAVLIDIGAATTDIAVYLGGELRHLAGITVGGHHITSDLASILEVSIEEAERLKRLHGAITADTEEEVFQWTPRNVAILQRQAAEGNVPPAAVRSVSAARLVQVFDRIKAMLDEGELTRRLRAGAVITGGGSQMSGIVDVATAVLGMPVRTGAVLAGDGFPGIADPAVTASVGLVRYCLTRGAPAPAAPPPPEPRLPVGAGGMRIVHPMVMKGFSRQATIDVTPGRSCGQGQWGAQRGWGRVFRDWMREFVPARSDEY